MAVAGIESSAEVSRVIKRDLGRLRETAGQVVGLLFYGTLLKTMRQSELKGRYGHGGRGEEVFAAQLDGILARRMGSATKGGLKDVLYHALERQQRLMSKQPAANGRTV